MVCLQCAGEPKAASAEVLPCKHSLVLLPDLMAVTHTRTLLPANLRSQLPCLAASPLPLPSPLPTPFPPIPVCLPAGDLFDGSLLLQDVGAELWEVERQAGPKLTVMWGTDVDDFDHETQVRSVDSIHEGVGALLLCTVIVTLPSPQHPKCSLCPSTPPPPGAAAHSEYP
jgi:hypothetical protein